MQTNNIMERSGISSRFSLTKSINIVSSFVEHLSKKKLTLFLHDEIQWHCDKDMITYIVLKHNICIATDWLAETNTTIFSWILSTTTSFHLISNTGLANNHDCYLYCSKVIAIVSVLYFHDTTLYIVINHILLK